jgi:outer membrane protein assembly factor BamB
MIRGSLSRCWLVIGVATMFLATAAPIIAARQATPTATAPAPPLQCPARPVTPAALVSILQSPAPEDPDAEDPRGDPVPPPDRATIGELIAAWNQCLASGDVPGILGLFTPDGVRRLLGERSPLLGGPAGLRVNILGMTDVLRLRDGRIAARLTIDPSGSGTSPPVALVVVIEQDVDGAWRIDHVREAGVGMPEAGGGSSGRALLRRPIAPGPGVPIRAPGPNVPMRGADVARSGLQAGPAPAPEPIEIWRTPTGWHSVSQPIMARGLIYFGGFSLGERIPLLAAVDAETGGIRWQTTAPVAWAEIPDSPALGSEVLFAPVQAPVSGVLAVVAATGEPLWYAPFGFTSVTAPASDASTVYVAGWGVHNARDRTENDTSGAVFALDQRTGRERWRFLGPARFGPLALGPDAVYVPSDHGLYALDQRTGRKRWQARFTPDAGETPVIAGNNVVFAGAEITSGKTGVFALDATSGALHWRVDLPAAPGAHAGVAVANGTVFVTWWDTTNDASAQGTPTLRAYALDTGRERWVFLAGDDAPSKGTVGTGSMTAPVVAGDAVVFGVAVRAATEGATSRADGLYAIDTKTGALRWHGSPATPIRSAPVVLDGTIYAMGGLRPRGDASGGSLLAFGVE